MMFFPTRAVLRGRIGESECHRHRLMLCLVNANVNRDRRILCEITGRTASPGKIHGNTDVAMYSTDSAAG